MKHVENNVNIAARYFRRMRAAVRGEMMNIDGA